MAVSAPARTPRTNARPVLRSTTCTVALKSRLVMLVRLIRSTSFLVLESVIHSSRLDWVRLRSDRFTLTITSTLGPSSLPSIAMVAGST